MSALADSALGAVVRSRISNLDTSENWLAEQTMIPRSTLQRRLATPRTFKLAEIERVAAVLELDGWWLARLAAADLSAG